MNNAVIGFFLVIILIFSGVAIQTAEDKTTRKNELDNSLGAAMEQSMKILTVNPVYHIEKEDGSDELAADFIQGFLLKTTSNSDYTIEILDIDVEKGLLDVRAEETYKQVIGHGKISCRKTVILEDLVEKEDIFYHVSFQAGYAEHKGEEAKDYVLKQISIHSGDNLTAEALPNINMDKEGRRFRGWRIVKPEDHTGILYNRENISDICVTEEIVLQAVYQTEEVI